MYERCVQYASLLLVFSAWSQNELTAHHNNQNRNKQTENLTLKNLKTYYAFMLLEVTTLQHDTFKLNFSVPTSIKVIIITQIIK